MKVLVACEFSGIVREAFSKKGHDAWSCDLLPTEIPGQHIQDDVLKYLDKGWDLMIAHPPCTYLCNSGARWWMNKKAEQQNAINFFLTLYNTKINKIAVENPIGTMSRILKKPDQIIRPFQFGESSTKSTCLWLKNLPKLIPTKIIAPIYHITKSGLKYDKWWFDTGLISNLVERSKTRSRTFQGIAEAIADQWS